MTLAFLVVSGLSTCDSRGSLNLKPDNGAEKCLCKVKKRTYIFCFGVVVVVVYLLLLSSSSSSYILLLLLHGATMGDQSVETFGSKIFERLETLHTPHHPPSLPNNVDFS